MSNNTKKQNKKAETSTEMQMAMDIRYLLETTNEYLDKKRILPIEDLEFLRRLFVDVKEFVDALYKD